MKLRITVDGKVFEVEVEVADTPPAMPTPYYVAEPSLAHVPGGAAVVPPGEADAGVDEDKVCRSPIAGTVVRNSVQAGQSIQPGDVLLVLEAMKMETSITAPVAARIHVVKVNVGDSVRAGQVLVEFD